MVDLTEFKEAVSLITKGTPEQKLQFLFDVYDVDGRFFFILSIIDRARLAEKSARKDEKTLFWLPPITAR